MTICREAHSAAGDAVSMSLAHAASFLLAMIFAVIVPRYLGAADYGQWMMFRGLAVFWLSICALGDREVMSCYYIPEIEKGNMSIAAQVFNSVCFARAVMTVFCVGGAVWMFSQSSSVYAGRVGTTCLIVTVSIKSVEANLRSLFYGQRRLVMVAVVQVLQAFFVPLLVLLAYMYKGNRVIPLAMVGADAAVLGFSWMMATIDHPRRAGRLPWLEWWPMLRYALGVSMATTMIVSANQLLLYMMNMRGYSSQAMGWVGLSVRCCWVAQTGLMAISGALMPVLASVQAKHGTPRMLLWQNFLSRLGVMMLMMTGGNLFIFGAELVHLLWGSEYGPVAPLLLGTLGAVLMLWLSSQWIRQFLLSRDIKVYLCCSLVYASVVLGGVWGMPIHNSGWPPILSMMAAGTSIAVLSGLYAVRHGASVRWMFRFLLPSIWLIGAWHIGHSAKSAGRLFLYAGLWNAGLVALFFFAGTMRRFEMIDMWRALRGMRVR